MKKFISIGNDIISVSYEVDTWQWYVKLSIVNMKGLCNTLSSFAILGVWNNIGERIVGRDFNLNIDSISLAVEEYHRLLKWTTDEKIAIIVNDFLSAMDANAIMEDITLLIGV